MSEAFSAKNFGRAESWQLPEISTGNGTREGSANDASGRSAKALEQLQRQAWQEGFDRGMQKGKAAGEAEVRGEAKKLEALVGAMRMPLKDVDEAFLREIARLSLTLARALICGQLRVFPESVVQLVQEALKDLPAESRRIRIELNPGDVELVREHLPDLEQGGNVVLIKSQKLARGDCEVSSRDSHIDARLDTRIRNLAEQMLGPEAFEAAHENTEDQD